MSYEIYEINELWIKKFWYKKSLDSMFLKNEEMISDINNLIINYHRSQFLNHKNLKKP